MDDVTNILSSLRLQIQNESENLKLLQSQKVALMREKDKLLEQTESEDTESLPLAPVDHKMYQEVFPLVSEIHQLEVRQQEIHHQLHLLEVHKDIKNIYRTLTSVAHTNAREGALHPWFEQLKSESKASPKIFGEKTGMCVLKQPSYKCDVECDRLIERLGFTLAYSGLTLHVVISSHSRLPERCVMEDMLSVTSDIHLQGLEDKTRHLLQQKNSVMELVDFIKESLENNIVPYM